MRLLLLFAFACTAESTYCPTGHEWNGERCVSADVGEGGDVPDTGDTADTGE